MPVDFDLIYNTDLTFIDQCWKLCGDAHCCSFSRYKSRFKLIGTPPVQQLPLLPGEYDWLGKSGRLASFKPHDHRTVVHEFGGRRLRVESMVGRVEGCLCAHGSRTTICRLYPILPRMDEHGQLRGADLEFGSFEVLEALEGLDRACQVDRLPLTQLNHLLALTAAIAADPLALYYVMAYSLTKDHVRQRLPTLAEARPGADYFSVYEMSLIRKQLIDWTALDAALADLAARFERRYGSAFSLS